MTFAWNPKKHGVLATGGTNPDNVICIWDVNSSNNNQNEEAAPNHMISC